MTFLPIAERELRVASRRRWAFWTRAASALVALVIGAMFLSLSAGLFVSAISRDSQRALAGTLDLLLLLIAVGPSIDAARAGLSQSAFEPLLGLSSPGYLFVTAGISTLLCLGKDLAFSLWARARLHSEFRERAAQTGAVVGLATPPAMPPATANAAATR